MFLCLLLFIVSLFDRLFSIFPVEFSPPPRSPSLRIITRYQTRYPVITRCGRELHVLAREEKKSGDVDAASSTRHEQRFMLYAKKGEKRCIPSVLVRRIENEILYRSDRGQGTAYAARENGRGETV